MESPWRWWRPRGLWSVGTTFKTAHNGFKMDLSMNVLLQAACITGGCRGITWLTTCAAQQQLYRCVLIFWFCEFTSLFFVLLPFHLTLFLTFISSWCHNLKVCPRLSSSTSLVLICFKSPCAVFFLIHLSNVKSLNMKCTCCCFFNTVSMLSVPPPHLAGKRTASGLPQLPVSAHLSQSRRSVRHPADILRPPGALGRKPLRPDLSPQVGPNLSRGQPHSSCSHATHACGFFLMRFLVTLVKNCPDWLNKEW